MKIKTKKQLNLPQLIEWAWENDVRGQLFPTDQNQEAGIYIATNRDLMMNNADYIKYNNTFTVEVEEEITEDTVFVNLIHIYVNPEDIKFSVVQKNVPIKCVKHDDYLRTLAFYILNDDLTMTLIWTCEKGLVE